MPLSIWLKTAALSRFVIGSPGIFLHLLNECASFPLLVPLGFGIALQLPNDPDFGGILHNAPNVLSINRSVIWLLPTVSDQGNSKKPR